MNSIWFDEDASAMSLLTGPHLSSISQNGMPVRIQYLGSNTSIGSAEFYSLNFLPDTSTVAELSQLGLHCDSTAKCADDLGFCAWFVQRQLQLLLDCFDKNLTCSSVRAYVNIDQKLACLTPHPQVGNEWRVRDCSFAFTAHPINITPWTPSDENVAAWKHVHALQRRHRAGLHRAGLAPCSSLETCDGLSTTAAPLSLLTNDDCNPATIVVTSYSLADVAISYFMWPWRQSSSIYCYLKELHDKNPTDEEAVGYHGLLSTRKLLFNRRVMLAALKFNTVVNVQMRNCDIAPFVPDELMKNDDELAAEVLKLSPLQFSRASPKLQNDRECVLGVVKKCGRALQFASAELRADRGVVLAAVDKDGLALEFASPDLQSDRAVVRAAVQNNSKAVGFASSELRNDIRVMIHAVKRFKRNVLQHASADLQNNKPLVLAAVKQQVSSINHASAELRRDKDVAFATVAHKKLCALEHVDDSLRDDDDVAVAAVAANPANAWCASHRLRSDPMFMLAAVIQEYKGIILSATPELAAHVKNALKARGVSKADELFL